MTHLIIFLLAIANKDFLMEVKRKDLSLLSAAGDTFRKARLRPRRAPLPGGEEEVIKIILEEKDLVLVIGNKEATSLMREEGISYKILDSLREGENYFLVWKPVVITGGEIILEREGFFLIRAKGLEDIHFYPRLPEGVYKIPFTPIKFSPDGWQAPKTRADSLIQEMVNKVSSDTILSFVQRLQNFRTRYSSTDSAFACANFIKDKFRDYNLDSVYFHSFRSDFAPNVIGIKRGQEPESVYLVLCAHFDSYSGSPQEFAPGADDNGSGTALVLEVARILKDYHFQHNIRFIAFSGEEEGLLGSEAYCYQARNLHYDSIIACLNGDMFAYTLPNRDSCSVIGKPSNPNCAPLVDYFIQCAQAYTNLKCQRQVIDRPRSDHASFNRYGYIAIHLRENLNLFNPYYHTTGDTIGAGFNDLNFVTEVVKATLATLASLAEPILVGMKEERVSNKGDGKWDNFTFYNIFGQRIKEGNLPPGIYFLREKKGVKKFIKLK